MAASGLHRDGRDPRQLEWILPSVSGQTDAQGRFQLDGLSPGTVVIEVSHGDYPGFRQSVEVQDGRVTDATILIESSGVIEGTFSIEDAGSRPLGEAQIFLTGETATVGLRTGKDGGFRYDAAASGSYVAQGLVESPGRLLCASQAIEVKAGESVRVDLVVRPDRRLHGRVHPVTGEEVSLWPTRTGAGTYLSVKPDANGEDEILGAPPGEYTIGMGGVSEVLSLPEGAYDIRRDFDLPIDSGK